MLRVTPVTAPSSNVVKRILTEQHNPRLPSTGNVSLALVSQIFGSEQARHILIANRP